MPLRQREVRVVLEACVGWGALDFDPRRLGTDEAMDVLWRLGKRSVDRAGVGMHELGPSWIPYPEGATTPSTEVASAAA